MHVGLSGTMSALMIEEIARKTRRGLEGRVARGRSGGGSCYGYRKVLAFDERGQQEHGLREIVPFVSGQVPAATLVAAYAPPDITSELVPRLGSTDGGDPIAIAGTNFGLAPLRVESREERDLFLNQPLPSSVDGWVASDGLRLPQEILRVNFARLCFSRYNDSQGFRPPVLFPCGNAVLTHEPNAITLRGPPGIGVNRSVSVTIMDRLPGGGYVEFTSRAVNFSYLPPEVTTVQPRPVPMDGVNTRLITLQGNNFGRTEGSGDAWTAEELAVRVVVGRDTECRDAIRFEDVRSGAIMLRCALGNTPVGSKNLTYTVAGQSGFNDAQAGIATVFAPHGATGRTSGVHLGQPPYMEARR
jgi:hypothetical protein